MAQVNITPSIRHGFAWRNAKSDVFRENDKAQVRFWAKVRRGCECWLWLSQRTPGGYGQFHFGPRGTPPWYAHRLSWELANGPVPDGLSVLHHCDTPACVNPQHLFVGTHTDNMRDASRKGRLVRRRKQREAA